MGTRLQLQAVLENLIGKRADGKQNVYFQPPESLKLVYPCIIYGWDNVASVHADNRIYRHVQAYQITLIEQTPDTYLKDKILDSFQMIDYERGFVSNNLYHKVFKLYY